VLVSWPADNRAVLYHELNQFRMIDAI